MVLFSSSLGKDPRIRFDLRANVSKIGVLNRTRVVVVQSRMRSRILRSEFRTTVR